MLRLAVIGDPIAHSLSPKVHGDALSALGVSYTYEKIRVKKGELDGFITYARENLDGFNLTMPHKVDVLPFLDEIEEGAAQFGAVNTVKVQNGMLYGYNTDAGGYAEALNGEGYPAENRRVLILGAGGVVQTLARELLRRGAKKICILNRTLEKAVEIAKLNPERISAGKMTGETLKEAAKICDILIQGTPLGMHGVEQDFEDLTFLEQLPKNAIVTDLIYNPPKTTLLKKAEELGLATMNGYGMLIYQALLADQIYTGIDFPMKDVYEQIK